MKIRSLALLPLLIVLAIAGCGGDDDTSTTSTTSEVSGATGTGGVALTEDEFLTQGNAICAAGNKEIEQAANDTFTSGQPTDAQLEQFAAIFIPSVRGQIEAIQALTPPEELADQVDTFLADAQDAADQAEADPTLIVSSNDSGPFGAVNDAADEIGLTECGK
jgi:hypothetical protein